MNYLMAFFFKLFKGDKTKIYHFFSYISEKYLRPHFSGDLKDLMMYLFLTDKLIQKTNGLIWTKIHRGKVSSILFAIPCFLTVSTCHLAFPETFKPICELWDLFLVEGFLAVIKYLLYQLQLQQNLIFKLPNEELLFSLKDLNLHPLAVMRYAKIHEAIVVSNLRHLNKKNILGYGIDEGFFERLLLHYEKIHKPILEFWNEG